jgi:adenosylhomocysteine nucleosidase
MSATTRRYGFLAPMPPELAPLRKALHLSADGEGPGAIHTGAVDGQPVVGLLTGIGLDRARARTETLLADHRVDHVVVIGVAGGLGADVAVGDVVVPEVVVDLASGRELVPTPLGTVAHGGRLLSSDDFITDPERLAELRADGAWAIDMETAAVAMVCEDRGVPWSVFRGISDDAFDPAVDEAVLGLTKPDGTPDLAAVTRFVGRNPTRVRLLARLGRDLKSATTGAVSTALTAIRTHVPQ